MLTGNEIYFFFFLICTITLAFGPIFPQGECSLHLLDLLQSKRWNGKVL